nr:ABC transporter substrate-binding protein [uncultured Lacibacter sp.]
MALLKANAQTNHVRLHLKWWHQFQFAGYYAADVKGFYKAEGLDVTIIPADKEHPPVKAILNKEADFAVTGSDIILNFAKGDPLIVVAPIFQHSAYTVISLKGSNINTPADLIGKRIMASEDQGWVQLQALFLKEGIPLDSLKVIPHSWNNTDLINGLTDAITGYISAEPYQLEKAGHHVHTILPVNYGIDFYGDLLFTSKEMLRDNPELIERFKRASFKGWEYAMMHKEELADHILTLPGVKERNVTKEALLFEAGQMEHLIMPGIVEIGHMNEGRWQHILSVHQSLGLIDSSTTLDGFLYDSEKTASGRITRSILYSSIAALFVLGIFLMYNLSLRRAVRKRTRELEAEVKERTKTQEQLQMNKERLQLAIQAAGIGIWDFDLENDLVQLEDSFHKNLGYTPGELVVNRDFLRPLVHPDDYAALRDNTAAGLQFSADSDHKNPGTIVRLQTKDKTWKWFLMSSKVVKWDDHGNAKQLSGIYFDIDDLKKKEIELSSLSTTLLKRNNELQQFAYITSHNLRAPVANLLSLSRLFKQEHLDEHNKIYFEKIKECISILNDTLNDVNEILSFRTVANEKMEPVQLDTELQTVIASVSEQINSTDTIINTNFHTPEVWFSKRIIRSIFQNLLTNAVKYRRKGVVPVITITSAEVKDFYEIRFSDNGSGIDLAQYGDKVFNLFQRFHAGIDGKGMGLYIVKTQLEALNGSIRISSSINQGTTFIIQLLKKEMQA